MTDLDPKLCRKSLQSMNLAAGRTFSDPPSGDAQSVRHTFSVAGVPFQDEVVVAMHMRDRSSRFPAAIHFSRSYSLLV